MSGTPVHFIYLAHGPDRFQRQALYSALTLLEFHEQFGFPWNIHIYTDRPEYYPATPLLSIEPITQELLAEWRGPLDFVHRAKIMLMRHAMDKLEGHVIFLDSDNCVFRNPAEVIAHLENGDSIMDKLEYLLDKPADLIGKKYKRFFKGNCDIPVPGTTIHVPQNHPVWNSGIIGVAKENQHLLEDALPICDYIYERFPKHLAEQLAVGIVLGQNTEVHAFRPYSFHWFGHGQAINRMIEEIFEECEGKSMEEQIAIVAHHKDRIRNAPLNPDKRPKWYKRIFKLGK